MKSINRALSEVEIQSSILEFLRYAKITAWRNNNGAVFDPKTKKFRAKNKWEKIHGDPVDILGILPDGKFLAIEVKKNEKEKPTEGQAKFLTAISTNGGLAFVAFSIDCCRRNLEDYLLN